MASAKLFLIWAFLLVFGDQVSAAALGESASRVFYAAIAFAELPTGTTLFPSVRVTCSCKFSCDFVIWPMGIKLGSITGICINRLNPFTQRSRSSADGAKSI